MIKQKQAFMKILAIELEDLDQDIELIINEYREKHDRDEISNYVFHENLALMQRELFGVQGFQKTLESVSMDDAETVEDLRNLILQKLDERIRANGLPGSIRHLVARKTDKVLRYVERLG